MATTKEPEVYYGTGRRKSSTARVYLTKGSGNIVANNRPIEKYFGRETARMVLRQPLVHLDMLNSVDVTVNVCGGGQSGQARRNSIGHRACFGSIQRSQSRSTSQGWFSYPRCSRS